MPNVSAAIMAHPVRADHVADLQARLDRQVPVIWDEDTSPPSNDRERRWQTGRRAWQATLTPDAEWGVVIQDDALPCPDLIAGLEQALTHVPDDINIVSPYLGTKRPVQLTYTKMARDARTVGAAWVCSLALSWGVAIACRTSTIQPMLDWCDMQRGKPYDMRVGRYYRDHLNQYCWYTWPSLVDHREGPSLIAHGDTGRHAHQHHTGSALDIDWSGPLVTDPRVLRREQQLARQASRRLPDDRRMPRATPLRR